MGIPIQQYVNKLRLNPGFPNGTVSDSSYICFVFFFNTALVTLLVVGKTWNQWLCFRDENHACYVHKHMSVCGLISVGLITGNWRFLFPLFYLARFPSALLPHSVSQKQLATPTPIQSDG